MTTDLELLLNDSTATPGADEATPDIGSEAETTPGTGATATPTDATDASTSTTDTSSESPVDPLDLATQGLKHPPQAPTTAPVAQAPASSAIPIPPEFQQKLNDPAEVKRLMNLDKHHGQLSAEIGQLRQMAQGYQGLPPPDQLRAQIQRQQQEAEAAKIKPWNPKHPDFQRTNSRLSNVRQFQSARQEIMSDPEFTPEQKNRLVGNIAARNGVTEDDVKLLREHESYTHEVKAELERDPDAFVQSRVERLFEQKFQQYEKYTQDKLQSEQFLEKNLPLIEQNRDAVSWAMNHDNRRDVAIRLAQLESENKSLLEKFKTNAATVETAKAQSHYTKNRATVKRDAVVVDDNSVANVVSKAAKGNMSRDQIFDELARATGFTS